jgi:hypothetical protein
MTMIADDNVSAFDGSQTIRTPSHAVGSTSASGASRDLQNLSGNPW